MAVSASAVVAGSVEPGSLVVRTEAIDDPGTLLDLLPPGGVAWVRRGEGMVAWGEVARITVTGPDRFVAAARQWAQTVRGAVVRDDVRVAGTGPVAFGSFTFADAGTSVLVVPQVVVGRRDGHAWVTTVAVGDRVPPPGLPTCAPPPAAPGAVRYRPGRLKPNQWTQAVRTARDAIERGELEKVVLAREVLARASRPVDPRWPLARLAASTRTAGPSMSTACSERRRRC
jgi:menaquinone-specific isochorismate synthase